MDLKRAEIAINEMSEIIVSYTEIFKQDGTITKEEQIRLDEINNQIEKISKVIEKEKNLEVIHKDKNSEAIYVTFPDYLIDTESFLGKISGLGHAGVILINPVGSTRYYEYGRYATKDGTKGRVRKITIPDVKIGDDGKATKKSLQKLLNYISKKSGQGGKIDAAYFVNVNFDMMNNYALKKLKESNPRYKEYNKDRESYSLYSNSCGTFAEDVILQDNCVDKPLVMFPSPINIVNEYQEEGNSQISFNPKTKKEKLTIGKGDESDAKDCN